MFLTPDSEDRYTRFDMDTGPGQGSVYAAAQYNGLGARFVRRSADGATHGMAYDGVSPGDALLYDGAGAIAYTPGIAQTSYASGKTLYTNVDALGSVHDTETDGSGGPADVLRTEAFGTTLTASSEPDALSLGWGASSSYQTDSDTGLTLLGNRYYDAPEGRFVSPDPAGYGDNWYAYCGNDPLDNLDPTGLKQWGSDPNNPYDPAPGSPSVGDTFTDPNGTVWTFSNSWAYASGDSGPTVPCTAWCGPGDAGSPPIDLGGPAPTGGDPRAAGADEAATFLLGGVSAIVLSSMGGPELGGGEALIPKPNLSSLPTLGMDTAEFGKFIGWGNKGSEALSRMQSLTDADIDAMAQKGLTKDIAKQWSEAYQQLHLHTLQRTRTADKFLNPLSRSQLMSHIAGRLP